MTEADLLMGERREGVTVNWELGAWEWELQESSSYPWQKKYTWLHGMA
jgi:hypothetical protein